MTVTRTSNPVRSPTPRRAWHWFAELDQRRIAVGPFSWLIQVEGIHLAPREVWVQVALVDQPLSSVVLHVSPYATAAHALAALRQWFSAMSFERPHVLEVMQIARSR